VTSGEFRDCFVSFVTNANGTAEHTCTAAALAKVQALDWDDLFLSKGIPKYEKPDFTNSLAKVSFSIRVVTICVF